MFLLLLMGLGAVSLNAQVRIGGNTPPNPAAALDLNAAEGTTTGTKGLALPRVTLGSSTATLDGTTANITGMLVYNTSGNLSTGVYYWNGVNWNRIDDGFLGGDTIVGNEVIGATLNRGLVTAGSGTKANPLTLGIATHGVDTSMLKAPSAPGYIWVAYNGYWRLAGNINIYQSQRTTAANTLRTDSIDPSGCLSQFVYKVRSQPNTMPSWSFDYNYGNVIKSINTVAWLGTVEAWCLKVL